MKRLILALFVLPIAVQGAENPLLSAPAKDISKWENKLKEFERPELPRKEGYPRPFHLPNGYKYSLDDVCLACHTFAAHKKDKKYAPFYNAHGTFLSCTTCHFVKSGLSYSWVEIDGDRAVGKEGGDFYGLRYIRNGNRVILSGGDSRARITPVYDGAPLVIPLKGNESLLKDVKAVSKMHSALTEKVLKCEDCHREKGVLDFRALGFSDERVKDLEENEVVKGLKEYKTIHFPKFIW